MSLDQLHSPLESLPCRAAREGVGTDDARDSELAEESRWIEVFHVTADDGNFKVERRRLSDPSTLGDGEFDYPGLIERQSLGILSAASFKRLSRVLREPGFSAAVLELPEFPNLYQPFPHRNPLRNVAGLRAFVRYTLQLQLLRRLFASSKVPLLIFDKLDASVIDGRWLPFLPLCHVYLKRELPKCIANAFLYSERVSIEAWKNLMRYDEAISKVRPLSLGFADEIAATAPEEFAKDIDIFWAGNTAISPVRERGLSILKKLRNSGLRVDLSEQKVSREEFYRKIARSYLVWAPEGTAWQCYRQWEVCAMQSVPVISYPTIWQDRPLLNGVHCFHYDPEGEDLADVVTNALKDREQLKAMGLQARPFVLKNHSVSAVYLRQVFAHVAIQHESRSR